MLLFKNREHKNIISEDTELLGNINTKSSVRIDGKFTGSIITKGEVKLSHSSNVSADITDENCHIEATFIVDVNLKEELELSSDAKFKGSIIARKIIYNKGCELTLALPDLIAGNDEETTVRTDS